MKVKVLKITDKTTVFLESALGNFKANRIGESPVIGREYFVEPDSKYAPTFDEIKISNSSAPTISEEGDKTTVTGLLTEYSNGCLTLELDGSIIELLVQENDKFGELIGKYVTIQNRMSKNGTVSLH